MDELADTRPLLDHIELRNVLSYGPEGQRLALGPLNVLIGPNGGGKSNLLDVFGFLNTGPARDGLVPSRLEFFDAFDPVAMLRSQV